MNFRKFHNMLECMKRSSDKIGANYVRLPDDPSGMIDCTAEGNYRNFKGLVGGYKFYYCESNNSTPLQENYAIKDEDMDIPKLFDDCLVVFDKKGLESIGRQFVGKDIICQERSSFTGSTNSVKIGEVTDAWVRKIRKSDKYYVLSVIFWLDEKNHKRIFPLNENKFYFSLERDATKLFCCNCGNETFATTCSSCKKKNFYKYVQNPIVNNVTLL